MSRKIKLSKELEAIVDDKDFEELSKHKWYAMKGKHTHYAVRNRNKNDGPGPEAILMHRIIMKATLGKQIDHIDGNGLNNRRDNMRFCTNQENQMNRKKSKNCSSIFKGVYWHKPTQKWLARITINKKKRHLGYFVEEVAAAMAYDKAATEAFGEFASLNFGKEI